MQVSRQELDGFTQVVSFQFDAQEMDRKLNREFKRIGSKAKIPGFRKGKVPLRILQQQYGASVLHDMQSSAINDSWAHVVQELRLNPLSMPDLQVDQPLRLKKGLAVTFSFDVVPPFELPKPDALTGEKVVWTVSEARLDREVEKLCERLGPWKALKRRKKCREGDQLTFNVRASIDGEQLDRLSEEGRAIELGQGQELPELEKKLTGLKIEESFTLKHTFPENAQEDVAGREVVFEGEVVNIQEKGKATIEEVLEQFPQETEEELRAQILEELTKHLSQKVQADLRSSVIEQLQTQSDFPLPPTVVDKMVHDQLHQHHHDEGEACDHDHNDEEVAEAREKAEKNLRFESIVLEYSRANDLKVTELDFNRHLLEMLQSAGEFGMQLFNFYRQPNNRARLEQMILDEKVVDSYIEGANFAEVERELGADDELE